MSMLLFAVCNPCILKLYPNYEQYLLFVFVNNYFLCLLHIIEIVSKMKVINHMRCIMDFLMNMQGPLLYFIIFFAKIIEVSISTIRIVFVNKGERAKGAMLGFVEILIWLVIVSSVLNNITEDPIKVFIYAAAFALGNYLGVTIESKIAVGLASIQVVVGQEDGELLADTLREQGYGVTIIEGKGKNESVKNLLFIQLKRRKIPAAVKVIKQHSPEAYITINDIKSMLGGYIK